MSQQRDNSHPGERATVLRAMATMGVCGVDIAVLVLVGVLLGNGADAHFHTPPLFLLVGLGLGLVAGFYSAYLIIAPIVRAM